MKKLTRREAMRAVVIAATGATLAACTPKTEQQATATGVTKQETVMTVVTATPAPQGPVTLRLLSGWNAPIWTELIAMFTADNPNIKFEYDSQWASVDLLLTTLASGNVYDLMHGDTSGLLDKGVFLPLDELIAASSKLKRDDFRPELWEGHMYNGKTYEVPVMEAGANPAFAWNATLMEQEGVAAGDGPKSWDDVISWQDVLKKKDDQGNIIQLGIDPMDGWGCTVICWDMAADTTTVTPDYKQALFDSDNWVAILEVIAKLLPAADQKAVAALAQQYPYWTGNSKCGFNQGKRLMIINGEWMPGELKTSLQDHPDWKVKYGWLPTLTGRKLINFGQSHGLAMAKVSQHPAEGFMFMEFMTSIEVNEYLFKLRGGWIPRKGLNLDFSLYPDLKWFSDAIEQAEKLYSPAMGAANPVFNQYNSAWNRAVEDVAFGRKTPKQAAQDCNAEAQKATDDYWAQQAS